MVNDTTTLNLEERVWDASFVTPMAQEGFDFIGLTIVSGHTGGVLYAPTRTGKSELIGMSKTRAQKVKGLRGNIFESATAALNATDRLVLSEGGFWTWMLDQIGHHQAHTKKDLGAKRHLCVQYFKGLANETPSGRVVLFVDEAQLLTLVELGWFADLFNALKKTGFKLVLFLVGSYHLQKWKHDLRGKMHAHVRSRFFAHEHPLKGIDTQEILRRCLHRYDEDRSQFDGTESFTSHFQPEWYAKGGRLALYAGEIRRAFGKACGSARTFEIPMEYFVLTVRKLLDGRPLQKITSTMLQKIVLDSGFAENYEPKAKG